MTAGTFLDDEDVREIAWPKPAGAPGSLTVERVLIAEGPDAFEVLLASAQAAPKTDDVRRLWSLRWNRRAAPVVLVVAHEAGGTWKAAVCGTRDDPAVLTNLDLAQVERICAAALAAPDAATADRTLHRLLVGQKDHLVAGLTNSGLFASHELRTGVPARSDWATKRATAEPLLRLRGTDLIHGLGFTSAAHGSTALLLSAHGAHQAIAVLLDEQDVFDRPAARFGAVSPVAHGLAAAQANNVPWLVVLRGTQIRLYSAKPDVGVGRKGQTETFLELDLALLSADDAAYLALLFSPDALAPNGTVAEVLRASADHAAALGERLRDRVYVDVVPDLAKAVAGHMGATSEAELAEAYHRTLVILFRLLFIAYAEDRGLLPYLRNPRYTKKALKTLAREFADNADLEFDPDATDRWEDLLAMWRAVDDGNHEWGVPAYNGGLFAADEVHPSGNAIAAMRLTNTQIGPALRALLVDTGPDGTRGPVDFRALSVREFGTIYEGLLESSLSVAPSDLTVDPRTKAYLPAKRRDIIDVRAGEVYFHNASGARKSTGSYFTKQFAVEHLLEAALEPALTDHLGRVKVAVDAGDDAKAADLFFDFRVADLAMGSGHFLVAAIDRIENRLSAFLVNHPIPAVADELDRLATAAHDALGDGAPDIEIETSALLRRQIARRCIYGLDLNPMAVELARLGIWIHTFVPGLPMSSLDHGLVVGNSLTGIGTLDELLNVLEPQRALGQYSLFLEQIETALSAAKERLVRAARTAEATKAEVRQAAEAHVRAMSEAGEAKALLDAAVGVRLGIIALPSSPEIAIRQGNRLEVQDKVAELCAVHLPYLFPEVFLRGRPGFDVILGNPPWEKVRWEAAPYWVGVFPGLMALNDKKREEKIAELRARHPIEAAEEERQQMLRAVQQQLFKKSYVLRGGTHLELAQLMLERALGLLSDTGYLGLVLPRQSMVLAGWKNLRERLVRRQDLHIVQGRNHSEWIFEDVEPRYAVVLLAASPARAYLTKVGVARSPAEIARMSYETMVAFTPADLADLSETNVIPWFNQPEDRRVFDVMRGGPRLGSGTGWIRATYGSRWDFTGSGRDNALAVRQDRSGAWRVLMTAHVDAFAFDMDAQFKQYVTDLAGLAARGRGVAVVNGRHVLTDQHPMIVIRRPSRSDDSRTLIATALPEVGMLPNNGSVHTVNAADGTSPVKHLALLGLLNTLTADWWVRRLVDRHVTAPIVNQLPLPSWSDDDIEMAAEITSALLARRGSTVLAGGIEVRDDTNASDIDLLAQLEHLTLRGYGLRCPEDLEMIARDFSVNGLPADLRKALGLREAVGA